MPTTPSHKMHSLSVEQSGTYIFSRLGTQKKCPQPLLCEGLRPFFTITSDAVLRTGSNGAVKGNAVALMPPKTGPIIQYVQSAELSLLLYTIICS